MPSQQGHRSEHAPKGKARTGFDAHVHNHDERSAVPTLKSAAPPHLTVGEVGHPAISKMSRGALQDATLPLDLRLAEQGTAARIFPQSLHVNGYLSLWDPTEGSVPSAIPLQDDGIEAASSAAPQVHRAGPVSVAAVNAMTVSTSVEPEIASMQASADPSDEKTLPTGSRILSTGDTPFEWAKQFIRLDLQGTAASLWLRDFRLDEAGRRALAVQLLLLARDAGKSVGRVIANGREIWRDDAWTLTDSTGEAHGR